MAALVVAAAVPLQSAPASAAVVTGRVCVETNEIIFNDVLDVSSNPGTGTINWTRKCALVTASTAPIGESAYVVDEFSSVGFSYFGNCALALLNGGVVNMIVGGSVLVVAQAAPVEARVQALIPDTPCNVRQATAVGPKIELSV